MTSFEKRFHRSLERVPFLGRGLDRHRKETLSGAALSFIMRGAGLVAAFLFSFLLARTFGAAGSGTYFLALSAANLAAVFGRLGLANVVVRRVAGARAVGDWRGVRGDLRGSMLITFVASSCAAILLWACAPLLSLHLFHKPDLLPVLRWMALAVPPMCFLTIQMSALRGLKRILDSMVVQGMGVPVLSALLLFLVGSSFGVPGAVWAYTLAAAATTLYGYWRFRSALPRAGSGAPATPWPRLLESSFPLFLMVLMNWTMEQSSNFFLGVWGTSEEIGIFNAAFKTASLVGLVVFAFGNISGPQFASFHRRKDLKALDASARYVTRMTLLWSVPVLALFLLFPGWVLGFYGEEFRAGAAALAILALGQFVHAAAGSVDQLLMMTGHEKLLRNRAVLLTLLNLGLNLCLVPSFGLMGAAVTTALGVALSNLIGVALVWRKLGIWLFPWGRGLVPSPRTR